MNFDICNGDADGLCAVVQWRWHEPGAARLITGLKRDIELLERVQAVHGDHLNVFDLSMQRNLRPLGKLLENGVSIRYFDHHHIDEIPQHPSLEAHIDTASDTCTSLLVDRYLGGESRAWAVVGAYGDNLTAVAERIAADLGLSYKQRRRLQSLGESINYNAYGDMEEDAPIRPALLYGKLVRYPHPLQFLEHEVIGEELETLRQDDLQQAQALPPYLQDARVSIHLLPDTPWSRRVSGNFSNLLASAEPLRAHALLRVTAAGDFMVSVRAPLKTPRGAAEFCRQFGGGGRAGAAGIDHLPADQMDPFINAFSSTQWG
jgi:hypothetical protein